MREGRLILFDRRCRRRRLRPINIQTLNITQTISTKWLINY